MPFNRASVGRTIFNKVVSILVAQTFLFSSVSFAIPQENLSNISKEKSVVVTTDSIVIPKDAGIVKSKFTGKDEKIIVHIQDAHCNFEAQSNIVKIIEALVKNDNLNFVAVEGADGPIDTSWFKAFPDEEIRKEVATYFMKKGEITGPEFLSITSDYNLKLFGAETRSYYLQNLNAFMTSYPLKDDTEKYFNSIKAALNRLKNFIYSDELKTLDARMQEYESKKMQFNDYVRVLQVMSERKKINLRAYDNFFKLISALLYEKKIDFNIVDKERTSLIDELSKKMTKEEIAELVTNSLAFKMSKISSVEFYDFLKASALKSGIEIPTKYPNLSNYIIYNAVYSKINNEKLFEDIKKIEIALKEKMFQNDDQRALEKLSRHVDILLGLVNIKLLNGDYDYYQAHKDEFTYETFADFIKKESVRYGLAYSVDAPSDAIINSIPKLEEFYSIAIKRDKALVDNTLSAMKKEKTRIAVLVTGGFHSEGIARLLEKQGVSYMVVCPSITKDVPTPYIQILTNQRTPFQDLLVGTAEAKETKGSMLAPYIISAAKQLKDKDIREFNNLCKTIGKLEGRGLDDRLAEVNIAWPNTYVARWIARAEKFAGRKSLSADKETLFRAYKLSIEEAIRKGRMDASQKEMAIELAAKAFNDIYAARGTEQAAAISGITAKAATKAARIEEAKAQPRAGVAAPGTSYISMGDIYKIRTEIQTAIIDGRVKDIVVGPEVMNVLKALPDSQPILQGLEDKNVVVRVVDNGPRVGFERLNAPRDGELYAFAYQEDGKTYVCVTRSFMFLNDVDHSYYHQAALKGIEKKLPEDQAKIRAGLAKVAVIMAETLNDCYNAVMARPAAEGITAIKVFMLAQAADRGDIDYLRSLLISEKNVQVKEAVKKAVAKCLYLNYTAKDIEERFLRDADLDVQAAARKVLDKLIEVIPSSFGTPDKKGEIFKDQDLRGTAQSNSLELSEQLPYEAAYRFGMSMAQNADIKAITGKEHLKIAVAKDVRISSPRLQKALMEGLMTAGADVVNIGLPYTSTPMASFAVQHYKDVDLVIQISASHLEWNYNGFKAVFRAKSGDVENLESKDLLSVSVGAAGSLAAAPRRGSYEDRSGEFFAAYKEFVKAQYIKWFNKGDKPLTGKKVAIDASNGVYGWFTEVVDELGGIPIPVNCTPNGYYPAHVPNPANAENLNDLREAVINNPGSTGVEYDSDGDRLAFIAEGGRDVSNHEVLCLTAQDLDTDMVVNSRTTMGVADEMAKKGLKAVKARSGYVFVKKLARQVHSKFGGEESGHFMPGPDFIDDGLLTTGRILATVDASGKTFGEAAKDTAYNSYLSIIDQGPLRPDLGGKNIEANKSISNQRWKEINQGVVNSLIEYFSSPEMRAAGFWMESWVGPDKWQDTANLEGENDAFMVYYGRRPDGRPLGWALYRPSLSQPSKMYIDLETYDAGDVTGEANMRILAQALQNGIEQAIQGITDAKIDSLPALIGQNISSLITKAKKDRMIRRGEGLKGSGTKKAPATDDITLEERAMYDRLCEKYATPLESTSVLKGIFRVIRNKGPPSARNIQKDIEKGILRVKVVDLEEAKAAGEEIQDALFFPRRDKRFMGSAGYYKQSLEEKLDSHSQPVRDGNGNIVREWVSTLFIPKAMLQECLRNEHLGAGWFIHESSEEFVSEYQGLSRHAYANMLEARVTSDNSNDFGLTDFTKFYLDHALKTGNIDYLYYFLSTYSSKKDPEGNILWYLHHMIHQLNGSKTYKNRPITTVQEMRLWYRNQLEYEESSTIFDEIASLVEFINKQDKARSSGESGAFTTAAQFKWAVKNELSKCNIPWLNEAIDDIDTAGLNVEQFSSMAMLAVNSYPIRKMKQVTDAVEALIEEGLVSRAIVEEALFQAKFPKNSKNISALISSLSNEKRSSQLEDINEARAVAYKYAENAGLAGNKEVSDIIYRDAIELPSGTWPNSRQAVSVYFESTAKALERLTDLPQFVRGEPGQSYLKKQCDYPDDMSEMIWLPKAPIKLSRSDYIRLDIPYANKAREEELRRRAEAATRALDDFETSIKQEKELESEMTDSAIQEIIDRHELNLTPEESAMLFFVKKDEKRTKKIFLGKLKLLLFGKDGKGKDKVYGRIDYWIDAKISGFIDLLANQLDIIRSYDPTGRIVVGIAGPGGAGKSTIVKLMDDSISRKDMTFESHGTDSEDYLHPTPLRYLITKPQRISEIEKGGMYNAQLLREHIRCLKDGGEFRTQGDTKTGKAGGTTVKAADINVIEGVYAAHELGVRSLLDMYMVLSDELPDSDKEKLKRKMLRDARRFTGRGGFTLPFGLWDYARKQFWEQTDIIGEDASSANMVWRQDTNTIYIRKDFEALPIIRDHYHNHVAGLTRGMGDYFRRTDATRYDNLRHALEELVDDYTSDEFEAIYKTCRREALRDAVSHTHIANIITSSDMIGRLTHSGRVNLKAFIEDLYKDISKEIIKDYRANEGREEDSIFFTNMKAGVEEIVSHNRYEKFASALGEMAAALNAAGASQNAQDAYDIKNAIKTYLKLLAEDYPIFSKGWIIKAMAEMSQNDNGKEEAFTIQAIIDDIMKETRKNKKVVRVLPVGPRGTRYFQSTGGAHGNPKPLCETIRTDQDGRRKSFLDLAVERALSGRNAWHSENVFVVTDASIVGRVQDSVNKYAVSPDNVFGEPRGANTAAVMGVSAILIGEQYGYDTVISAMTTDHDILDMDSLGASLDDIETQAALEPIVGILGVKPSGVDTSMGHVIKESSPIVGNNNGFNVKSFKEKPTPSEAEELTSQGAVWNSGKFIFRADAILRAFKEYQPEYYEGLMKIKAAIEKAKREHPEMPVVGLTALPEVAKVLKEEYERFASEKWGNQQFEKAIVEKAAAPGNASFAVDVSTFDGQWRDLGNSFQRYLDEETDDSGNVKRAPVADRVTFVRSIDSNAEINSSDTQTRIHVEGMDNCLVAYDDISNKLAVVAPRKHDIVLKKIYEAQQRDDKGLRKYVILDEPNPKGAARENILITKEDSNVSMTGNEGDILILDVKKARLSGKELEFEPFITNNDTFVYSEGGLTVTAGLKGVTVIRKGRDIFVYGPDAMAEAEKKLSEIASERLAKVKEMIASGTMTPDIAKQYAKEAAEMFVAAMKSGRGVIIPCIDILAAIGFHKDVNIANMAIGPLFGKVVFELKDSFAAREGEIYLRIYPRLVMAARDASPKMAKWFKDMGISESEPEEDLYRRSRELRKTRAPMSDAEKAKVKKVFVFSRVTIGADVYIDGIAIGKALKEFPNAEIVFVDATKLGKQVFSLPRVKNVDQFVNRAGETVSLKWNRTKTPIVERFDYVANLTEYIGMETESMESGEYIIIDPDTRLSHVGAMPLTKDTKAHCFIDTVLTDDDMGSTPGDVSGARTIGGILSGYLNNLLGGTEKNYPEVGISDNDQRTADTIWGGIPLKGKFVVATSFTTGLESKMLTEDYDKALTMELLERGITPFIEREPTPDIDARNINLIKFLRENGKRVLEIMVSRDGNITAAFQDARGAVQVKKFEDLTDKERAADVYTFATNIGALAGIMGKCNAGIGYDSKGQHVAAAMNVPYVTVFTGHISDVFPKRWASVSKNFMDIIEIDKRKGNYEKDAAFRDMCNSRAIAKAVEAIEVLKNIEMLERALKDIMPVASDVVNGQMDMDSAVSATSGILTPAMDGLIPGFVELVGCRGDRSIYGASDDVIAMALRIMQIQYLKRSPVTTDLNLIRYAWAGSANRIKYGLPEPVNEDDVAEVWFNSTVLKAEKGVMKENNPSLIQNTSFSIGKAKMNPIHLREVTGDLPYFVKFLSTRFAPRVTMGFNSTIGSITADQYADLAVNERKNVEELLTKFRKGMTREEFDKYLLAYEKWAIEESNSGWALPSSDERIAPIISEMKNYLSLDLAATAAIFNKIAGNRKALMAVTNEIVLEKDMAILSPAGHPHGINGLSLQTHPMEILTKADGTREYPKNEAWIVIGVNDASGKEHLILVEPQQMSNDTYSVADKYTPIVWDDKGGNPKMRKNVTYADIRGYVTNGLRMEATTPKDFIVEPKIITPANTHNVVVRSRIEDANKVWPEQYFVTHDLKFSGHGEDDKAKISMKVLRNEMLIITEGEVLIERPGKQPVRLVANTPSSSAYIPEEMGEYELTASGDATVLRFFMPDIRKSEAAAIPETESKGRKGIPPAGENKISGAMSENIPAQFSYDQLPEAERSKIEEYRKNATTADKRALEDLGYIVHEVEFRDDRSGQGWTDISGSMDLMNLIKTSFAEDSAEYANALEILLELQANLKDHSPAGGAIIAKNYNGRLIVASLDTSRPFDSDADYRRVEGGRNRGTGITTLKSMPWTFEHIRHEPLQERGKSPIVVQGNTIVMSKNLGTLSPVERGPGAVRDIVQDMEPVRMNAREIYERSTVPERDSLKSYLDSIAYNETALDNEVDVILYDTGVDMNMPTAHVEQAGERSINRYIDGRLVNIRSTGAKLLELGKAEVARLTAAGKKVRVVSIAGNATMKEKIKDKSGKDTDQGVGEGLKSLGKVLNIQNPDGRYIPVIGLYELALRIARDSSIEDITECLNRIALNPGNKPFTRDEVESLLTRGVLQLLPKIVPVNTAEAAEAYKAAQQALASV